MGSLASPSLDCTLHCTIDLHLYNCAPPSIDDREALLARARQRRSPGRDVRPIAARRQRAGAREELADEVERVGGGAIADVVGHAWDRLADAAVPAEVIAHVLERRTAETERDDVVGFAREHDVRHLDVVRRELSNQRVESAIRRTARILRRRGR